MLQVSKEETLVWLYILHCTDAGVCQRAFTFTGDAVRVAQLIAAAAETLVRAVDVHTLLTARAALALIQVWLKHRLVNE